MEEFGDKIVVVGGGIGGLPSGALVAGRGGGALSGIEGIADVSASHGGGGGGARVIGGATVGEIKGVLST